MGKGTSTLKCHCSPWPSWIATSTTRGEKQLPLFGDSSYSSGSMNCITVSVQKCPQYSYGCFTCSEYRQVSQPEELTFRNIDLGLIDVHLQLKGVDIVFELRMLQLTLSHFSIKF